MRKTVSLYFCACLILVVSACGGGGGGDGGAGGTPMPKFASTDDVAAAYQQTLLSAQLPSAFISSNLDRRSDDVGNCSQSGTQSFTADGTTIFSNDGVFASSKCAVGYDDSDGKKYLTITTDGSASFKCIDASQTESSCQSGTFVYGAGSTAPYVVTNDYSDDG